MPVPPVNISRNLYDSTTKLLWNKLKCFLYKRNTEIAHREFCIYKSTNDFYDSIQQGNINYKAQMIIKYNGIFNIFDINKQQIHG